MGVGKLSDTWEVASGDVSLDDGVLDTSTSDEPTFAEHFLATPTKGDAFLNQSYVDLRFAVTKTRSSFEATRRRSYHDVRSGLRLSTSDGRSIFIGRVGESRCWTVRTPTDGRFGSQRCAQKVRKVRRVLAGWLEPAHMAHSQSLLAFDGPTSPMPGGLQDTYADGGVRVSPADPSELLRPSTEPYEGMDARTRLSALEASIKRSERAARRAAACARDRD